MAARRWSPTRLNLGRHLDYGGLERLFQARTDPWSFQTSPYERARLATMFDFVQVVPHGRVLEVGCAEGHFTERLISICPAVTAIDLSADAIARATVRTPAARLLCCKLEDFPVPERRYDVIVCGEMLYYLEDLDAMLGKLQQLGTHLMTSTCYPSAVRIHAKLRRYRLLKKAFHLSVSERRAASIRLYEL